MRVDNTSAPGPEDFPEHRPDKQLEADRVHVRRQLGALSPDAEHERLERVIDRLAARQEQAPAEYAMPFERYQTERQDARDQYVLVARGQMVVRMGRGSDTGEPSPRELLRELGYRHDDRFPQVRDPRTEVWTAEKRSEEIAEDVRRLAGAGVEASAHVLVPLGHIIKSEDYPYVTAGPGTLAVGTAGTPKGKVRVAVIDTGISPEDRTDNWLDSVVREPDNTDLIDVLPASGGGHGDGRLDWWAGHGSFATGIVQRVAPGCEIVAYRFTHSDGLGTDKDVAEAMLAAAEEANNDGVRLIINASVGTPAVDGAPPMALKDAVQLISEKFPNVLIVASAGNNGTSEPMYPGAFEEVIAVGALTDAMRPAPFSSFGDWVDCSCVGVGVVSTFVPGVMPPEPDPLVPDYRFGPDSWALWTGTSFSAPQIVGIVARACLDDPDRSPRAVLDDLLSGRPEIPGYGRVLRILGGTPV